EFADADRYGRIGWQAARDLGQTYTRTTMGIGLGHSLLRQGRFDEALEVLEEGQRLFQVHEVPSGFSWTTALLGYACGRLGQADRGMALLRQTVDPGIRGQSVLYAHPFLWLAEACLCLGRRTEAGEAARRGFEIAAAQEEQAHRAWAERLLAEAMV